MFFKPIAETLSNLNEPLVFGHQHTVLIARAEIEDEFVAEMQDHIWAAPNGKLTGIDDLQACGVNKVSILVNNCRF